jgi:hypothetical protein
MTHLASVANGGEKAHHSAGLSKAVMLGGGGRLKAAGERGRKNEWRVLVLHEFVPAKCEYHSYSMNG